MKVKIGPYSNFFGCYQLADLFSYFGFSTDQCDKIGDLFSSMDWLVNFFNWIDQKKTRNVRIKIDNYDTWSFDHTLSLIILPGLKQLKETKHGAPLVDNEDVPKELHYNDKQDWEKVSDEEKTSHDVFFRRWDWILDEMIFAFENIIKDDDNFEDRDNYLRIQNRVNNGLKLFGKYFQCLWD